MNATLPQPLLAAHSTSSAINGPNHPSKPPTSYRDPLSQSRTKSFFEGNASASRLRHTSPSPHHSPVTFKYVVGELLGKGSYGSVYLALNATNGELMAVKRVETPQNRYSRQIEMIDALKFESKTMRDLEHPNIVQYLGFEETPEHLNIFLEYVPGGTIGSLVLKHGRFSDDVTKWFSAQILTGLEYIHSNGILHRDLKGDNILVEHSGVCKISDFGISKKEDGLGNHTGLRGTIYWMAPEVVESGTGAYSAKVDIWSLGCVVLEMLSGQRPWSGQEFITVMLKLHRDKLPPPMPADLQLSDLALDFRRQCFAMDPQTRPSAQVLRRHPYLELSPGWCFQLSDIEKPRPARRKVKRSSRHRNSSAPATVRSRTLTDVPVVPTVRPYGDLQLPVVEVSPLRPNTRRSPSRPPPADPPPIVYITPLNSPARRSSGDSISTPSSESTRTSASPRLRTRKSFYVINPDPDPRDRRTEPFVYTPPPLPAEPALRESSPQKPPSNAPLLSQKMIASGGRRQASAPSMPNLATSSRRSTHERNDSCSESDSDSGYSLWKKPPAELLPKSSTPSPPPTKETRRKSIIETGNITWAPRPNLQEVYGHLEEFFPKVDLDTPSSAQNDRQRKARSIRMVAAINRDAVVRRAATTTTKLWGHRVEEMT